MGIYEFFMRLIVLRWFMIMVKPDDHHLRLLKHSLPSEMWFRKTSLRSALLCNSNLTRLCVLSKTTLALPNKLSHSTVYILAHISIRLTNDVDPIFQRQMKTGQLSIIVTAHSTLFSVAALSCILTTTIDTRQRRPAGQIPLPVHIGTYAALCIAVPGVFTTIRESH